MLVCATGLLQAGSPPCRRPPACHFNTGSSTGLHMDYHCNLYVLLRGRKRFRLYPPSAAERMYVRGELAKIWPNGRIVFKSQVRCEGGWGRGS